MSRQIPITFVDAFTRDNNSPFTGNPAAICFLNYDDEIEDKIKQKIAAEINLSETAFVSYGWTKGEKPEPVEGSHRRTIRWFTPTNEVPLCGHATVASTKALVTYQIPEGDKIELSFETKFRGTLGATYTKRDNRITLNFPSNPTIPLNKADYPWLDEMTYKTLGDNISPNFVSDVQYSPKQKILLLRLEPGDMSAPDLLRKVTPDCKHLLKIETGEFVHDIIVTVKGEGPPHFYSRFFAPWDGVDEDPVCGMAHTILTPYWTQELGNEVGTMLANQLSIRGGHLYCTLLGDRVSLSGQARVVLKGELLL